MALSTPNKRGIIKRTIDKLSGTKKQDEYVGKTMEQADDLIKNIRNNSPKGRREQAEFLRKIKSTDYSKWR